MAVPELADRAMAQDKALVHAIEALATIDPDRAIEELLARLLLCIYM